MATSKKDALKLFLEADRSITLDDPVYFEEQFQNFCHERGIDVKGFGRSITRNELAHSAQYSKSLITKDPVLRRMMLDRNDQNIGYKIDDDEYGVKGMFRFYANEARQRRAGAARGSDPAREKSGGSGDWKPVNIPPGAIVLVVIAAFLLFYKTFGDALVHFVTSGILVKPVCILIAILASVGIVKDKNMGWPIHLKAFVLFIVWVMAIAIGNGDVPFPF